MLLTTVGGALVSQAWPTSAKVGQACVTSRACAHNMVPLFSSRLVYMATSHSTAPSTAAWAVCLALFYIVLHLLSLCSLYTVLCHICFCTSFSPFLFVGSITCHFENMLVPYQQPCGKATRTWCIIPYQLLLDSCWKHACETTKKNTGVFKFFMSQLLLIYKYDCIYSTTHEYIHHTYIIHTYIHTYIHIYMHHTCVNTYIHIYPYRHCLHSTH